MNYFKTNNDLLTINDVDLTSASITQTGNPNKAAKFYDTKYNDVITGGNKNDTYYFTKGGTDSVTDEKGRDTYKVKSLDNALTIADKAGKDSLIVSDKNGYSLYFDVSIDNTTDKNLTTVGTDLHIYRKDTHTNGVTMSNYLKKTESGVTKDFGCIETIKVGNDNLRIDVAKVAGDVASWLGGKGYTSSADVFENHPEKVYEMLAVYTGNPA